MGKFFIKFFITITIAIFTIVIYLSYFGLKTDKFDEIIKNKANEFNNQVKLDFQTTKIHLNIKELNLSVRLQNPKVILLDNEIYLSKLDLFLPIKSFFSSDFLLKRAEIAFAKNNIKDITKVTNIFLPRIINKQLNKIFKKGSIEGEFIIPFKPNGKVDKNYDFTGKISKAQINLTKKFIIKDLTSEILKKNNDEFTLLINRGSFLDLDLSGSNIALQNFKNKKKIKSILKTNGKINFFQIKKISSLFKSEMDFFKDIDGIIDLESNIVFDIGKNFKIKNLSYTSKGTINKLKLLTKEKKIIKKYLPDYDPKIIIKDTNILFVSSNKKNTFELNGLVKMKNEFENFQLEENYNHTNKSVDIKGFIDLTNSRVLVSRLNYKKDFGKKSKLNFNFNYLKNKYYNINELNFFADKNIIFLSGIKLDNNFEVLDFKNIKVKTFANTIKNNDFSIVKSDKILISGEVFDAQPLLISLYKKIDKRTFSKKFNSDLKINFDKALTGTNDDVSNFAMIASINKGSYNKLSLKGNFSKDEILEMSIYQIDKDKKTLQVISDRARPFIKNFHFIDGFEGGKLEYESIISKKESKSNLTITDFKVSKVPLLAKLLTLASFKGIADTLSGEGISFESFEMKSNTQENIMNIEDALAMGPAVSILLDGYVDKGKVVSLRGTLVPATKLNSFIASIPVVGDILVGKKTGEGVVGVSFKMKGSPKNIKTTVNPIKTLTPRFIVRAVEKLKKKKKEETK